MTRVLLTGAAGFIGARTCHLLLEQGFEVVGIDNMNTYYDVRLKEYRINRIKQHKRFDFYRLDIEDLGAVEDLFKKNRFEAVINLAARAGVNYSMQNPHIYMSTNAQGTLNLLEMMRRYEVKKMVLASTSSLYAGQPMPFKENLPVNTPISPYAASKKAAEVMAYTYHFLYDIDVTIVRYFTVYGPAGRPDMSIFRFIRWISQESPVELFGDGSQARDFTYVDDIARGTVMALKDLGYEIINLGGGQNPISIGRVLAMVEQLLDKKALLKMEDFHKTDIKETWADISKARAVLDWEPKIHFENGLKLTVDWYKKNINWVNQLTL